MYQIKDHKITAIPFHQAASFRSGGFHPKFIVLHYTAGRSYTSALRTLTTKSVSAHFLAGKGGELSQLVPLNKIAHHAGQSQYKGYIGLNKWSIGIEMDNHGKLKQIKKDQWVTWFNKKISNTEEVYSHWDRSHWTAYPKQQLEVVFDLVKFLTKEFNIPSQNIIGHEDITDRKQDPGPAFPLKELRGFCGNT